MSKISVSRAIDLIGLVVALLGVVGQFLTSKEKKEDSYETQETEKN